MKDYWDYPPTECSDCGVITPASKMLCPERKAFCPKCKDGAVSKAARNWWGNAPSGDGDGQASLQIAVDQLTTAVRALNVAHSELLKNAKGGRS